MNQKIGCLQLGMQLFGDEELHLGADARRQELTRARSMARAWANSIPDSQRSNCAALFARKALEAFATVKVPGVRLQSPVIEVCGKLDDTAAQLALSMGRIAATLPMATGCYLVTSLYATLLPPNTRSAFGAFYTPPALTRRLFDLATEGGVNWKTARVLDPACGGGAILLEAANRMRESLKGRDSAFILEQLGARLSGFELDPHAAALSQSALEIMLWDLAVASGQRIPVFVKVCNTLEKTPLPFYDLVIGNPPYGRVPLTVEQRMRFSRSLYGHANLYGVFTDIALRWTRPSGLIAYLTPTSVLGGQYYAALRKLLANEAPPIAVDFVHARKGVFEDVLQETLLALYKRGAKQTPFQVNYLKLEGEHTAHVTKNGKVSLPYNPGAPWLAPRRQSHIKLIEACGRWDARLADWGYEISTGPLVWNRFKSQIHARSSQGVYPLIWAEAVTTDGNFVFRANKRKHAPYFKPESGDEWLIVRDSCVLVQRTTAKEQPRRLIAAELPDTFLREHGGVVIENHLNMVRAVDKPLVSPAAVTAFLNSEVVDQIFRCISGSVAVSAFELEAIPLPSVKSMSKIEKLVVGKASQDTIEKALRNLLGLKTA